jgi:tRNA(Ile)-lysidine synthase
MNHKLRASESDADAGFVAHLASEYKLQFHSATTDVTQHAAGAAQSIETAARELRYNFFRKLVGENSTPVLDKLVTGHTLDDQAETVLMRIIRGTGMRGLRAIQTRLEFERENGTGEIIRPLLDVRRRQLVAYLQELGQGWREDATNLDRKFTRNRVRHLLLPLLEEEFNPSIAERLAELAEIARGEQDYWDTEAAGWMDTGVHWAEPERTRLVQLLPAASQPSLSPKTQASNAIIDLLWLLSEPLAVQRRIIKSVGDEAGLALEFKQVEDILRFGTEESGGGKELALPHGWKVCREEDHLEFAGPSASLKVSHDYQYRLDVPGEVVAPEAGSIFQAVQGQLLQDCDPEHLFSPEHLERPLLVRNWRPGDRFWPAYTKQPRKIKELLQQHHVAEPDRKSWPVIVSGTEIIWVRGLPGRAHFRPEAGKPAILIREVSTE